MKTAILKINETIDKSIYKNITDSFIDSYNKESPVECYKLKIIGLYCVFLFISGMFINSLLLWVFYKNKDLRTPINVFVIGLTIFNLLGCLIQIPFVISSNLNCKWIFKKNGCILSGFIMYFIACTSMYIMVAISIERFYIIYKPTSIRKIKIGMNVKVILACSILGFVWAILPVLGWSHYTLEGALTSCAVEWRENSALVFSYNVTIFVFVFLIPLIIIVATSIFLVILVIKSAKRKTLSLDKSAIKIIYRERKVSVNIILFVLIFIFSWTPYALVSMYCAFIDPINGVDPILTTIPAIFAKSYMLFTPVYYLFSNRFIRQKLKGTFFGEKKEKHRTSIVERTKIEMQNLNQEI